MRYIGDISTRGEDVCILHVDDDAGFLEVASEALDRELESPRVVTAETAVSGLELLGEHDVDCIVSDYDMPRMDGLEFLDEVRESEPALPFILFTGRGSEEVASDAISRGVTDYLKKGPGLDVFTLLGNRIEHAVSRYRSQQILRYREQSLARAQRLANLGNWDWDIVDDRLYWSEQVHRIFGVEDGAFDVTYERFLEFVHPDDRNAVRRAVDAALEDREPYRIDHRVIRADGEERVVHEHAEVVRDDAGDPIAMVGTVQDITERVEQRNELAAFREAVTHAGHSIYWTDPDGTIQYVNPAFEEMTGYSAEEAVGETPRLLKSGEHAEAFYADLWETITSGDVWRSTVVNRRKSGERYVVDQTIAPITSDTGDVVGFVAVNSEVSSSGRTSSVPEETDGDTERHRGSEGVDAHEG